MDAARHWARGDPGEDASDGDDEWREELKGLGVAPGEIERALDGRADAGDAEGDAFEVWPENAGTVEIFLSARTQWSVVAGMGGIHIQGFRYADLEALLRVRRVKHRARVFEDLQLMEASALEVLNRK